MSSGKIDHILWTRGTKWAVLRYPLEKKYDTARVRERVAERNAVGGHAILLLPRKSDTLRHQDVAISHRGIKNSNNHLLLACLLGLHQAPFEKQGRAGSQFDLSSCTGETHENDRD